MSNGKANFSYLGGDGSWSDFQWAGLELSSDGALRLSSLPLLEGDLPEVLASAARPDGPAGIAVDRNGTVYFSDPSSNKLGRVDGCDGMIGELPCSGGEGDEPTEFHTPRGLFIAHHRRSIFVADSANHRVQVFDLASSQLVGIWGQRASESGPGRKAGRLDTPWAIAGDSDGNLYVVDYGNRRVQKFNRVGDTVASFWETIKDNAPLEKPCDVAVYSDDEATRVYILDETLRSVFVFYADGNPVRDSEAYPVSFGSEQLKKPMGIAASQDAIYIGDNARRRVLKFKKDDFSYIGVAVGYRGPVAALAFDHEGNLLVHTGTGLAPLRLAITKGHRTRGVLWSRAIRLPNGRVKWHRLQSVIERLEPGARLRLFVHTSNNESDAPKVNPTAENPFADPKWRPRSEGPDQFANQQDLYIGGEAAKFLWVGALFSGDGQTTPTLSQLRVEFDHEDYSKHLPAIYREDAPSGDFLLRFLSLIESLFGEVESSIDDLSLLFDTVAAPKQFLPWLASWLALELDEDWSDERQRQAIASAFETYSRRGTAEGLREAIRTFAGVSAIIEEPISNAAWWALPAQNNSCKCKKAERARGETEWRATDDSILGVTTMLAPAAACGAVVGSTAILDASHLITDEEFGSPLFEDVANRFSVEIYRGQLGCAETLARLREVIEREKPAHTTYHLCIIEPRLRVGFQARIGIDAVVGGEPARIKLGEAALEGSALGGAPAGRIGEESRIGITTRVG